jgi:hypothetical protein
MNRIRVVNLLLVIALIVTIEALRYFTGLPITVIDLLMFPASIILIALSLKSLLFHRTTSIEIVRQQNKPSLYSLMLRFFTAIAGLLLGLWSLYEGANNPLLLYTGVKGAAHGYTLFTLGLLVFGFSGYLIYITIIDFRKKSN